MTKSEIKFQQRQLCLHLALYCSGDLNVHKNLKFLIIAQL